ncbi:dipeptidyl peptidase IV N-terminal region-domain-containing protein [Delphinella strobiligena]|nr:dipeptidyl peptidase IV N-terminal region-domain-containing protein [Delphinella strobiligena]
MTKSEQYHDEESLPLTSGESDGVRYSEDEPRQSTSTVSTTSLVLEHITGNNSSLKAKEALYGSQRAQQFDVEDGPPWHSVTRPVDKKARKILWILVGVAALGWVAALFLFIGSGAHKPLSSKPHDPHATSTPGNGHKVTLEQILSGQWWPKSHAISWIGGANGEDGLLLQRGGEGGRDYLVVEDVRYMDDVTAAKENSKTLMKDGMFNVGAKYVVPDEVWPSPDLKKVLVRSDYQKNWRHSGTGLYWIFDVESHTGQALDPDKADLRVQIASWAPTSDAIVYTRNNNMYVRNISDTFVRQITTDGGAELFYGIPDWVYEEEVFSGNSATWWSGDGKFVAFLRTDESKVPTYPVQYFFSRPSGKEPEPGEENYPEVRQIKYPKAGAPMSVVTLQFYDVAEKEIFTVPIEDDFADDDRLITEVVWAGSSGKALIRVTNRESDIMKVIVVDAAKRTGKTVRETDVNAIDGGWFEVSESTAYVPADPENGRPYDGYIDTIIHEGYDHLAYYTPLESADPIMLTSGKWEVVRAPSAVDLKNNIVYYVSTEKSSIERHIYSVKLDGSSKTPITDVSSIAYYSASFSKKAGYALLSYQGPGIPWQKVINTPSVSQNTEIVLEENQALNELATKSELPINVYQTINIDGFELNLVERRPPHFDENKKYPVLFYLYNGPGFQEVDRKFGVNFQSFVASSLGYIVVTLDGRGTGYLGRPTRTVVRGNLGYWEAHDQIAAAKKWAAKPYVDADRIGIWGWSYGGFMTLKTLEQDGGQTFKYGMAVAPVTDWRFYDSIYTERYMHTPQHNLEGYENATISNVTALGQNVRFLVMHGVADDNVHMQNTLSLLDRLDLGNIVNYDVHVFPDSDHSIYFHNANRVVYEKLTTWLINAFNGEWLKTDHPKPLAQID